MEDTSGLVPDAGTGERHPALDRGRAYRGGSFRYDPAVLAIDYRLSRLPGGSDDVIGGAPRPRPPGVALSSAGALNRVPRAAIPGRGAGAEVHGPSNPAPLTLSSMRFASMHDTRRRPRRARSSGRALAGLLLAAGAIPSCSSPSMSALHTQLNEQPAMIAVRPISDGPIFGISHLQDTEGQIVLEGKIEPNGTTRGYIQIGDASGANLKRLDKQNVAYRLEIDVTATPPTMKIFEPGVTDPIHELTLGRKDRGARWKHRLWTVRKSIQGGQRITLIGASSKVGASWIEGQFTLVEPR